MSTIKKEFVLKHIFESISTMEEVKKHYSQEEEHLNIPWKMYIYKNKENLSFFLNCRKPLENGKWSIDTSFELKLMSANGKNIIHKSDAVFGNLNGNATTDAYGWPDFVSWEKMKDEYLIDEKLTVEAFVKIKKMVGIDKKKLRNFDETTKQLSDIVLIVENEKFYVSKLFLACQSTYFMSMFLGNFDEAKKSTIKLTDVSSEHFQNFLEDLHGDLAIDDDTVDGILNLANMYNAQNSIRRCQDFLLKESEKPMKDKLEMAVKYNLNKLKEECLVNIKTIDDIRSAVPTDLEQMDHSVLAALLRKAISNQ